MIAPRIVTNSGSYMQLHSATATPRDMRDLPLIPPMKIVFHDAIDFSAGNDNLIVPGDLEIAN